LGLSTNLTVIFQSVSPNGDSTYAQLEETTHPSGPCAPGRAALRRDQPARREYALCPQTRYRDSSSHGEFTTVDLGETTITGNLQAELITPAADPPNTIEISGDFEAAR
jgi:hypothetical protein